MQRVYDKLTIELFTKTKLAYLSDKSVDNFFMLSSRYKGMKRISIRKYGIYNRGNLIPR